jgi:hypothetical protein
MTTPDDQGPEPVPFVDFDPYRFGAPEHPIAPEYAVPGYVPPTPPPHLGPPPVAPPLPPHLAAQPGPAQVPYGQPYPPPPGYYPPPGYPAPPAQQVPLKTGVPGRAQASLVLGIASVALFWLSLLNIVPIVLAFVFGFIGLGESRVRPNRVGRGVAIAGMVLAAVGAVGTIIFNVWELRTIQPCLDMEFGSSAYSDCIRDHI